MGDPHVPGATRETLTLACGEEVRRNTFDMGMREYRCACGETHAVVMDIHPLSRWIPESVVRVLEEVVEPTDEADRFETMHVMGIVREEYPEGVLVSDDSENPAVGWALLWVTDMDAPRLHRVIVELLIEMMDHAIGHAEDPTIHDQFDQQLDAFDIDAFIEEYRSAREFEDIGDRAI